jgi:hypothetical protein
VSPSASAFSSFDKPIPASVVDAKALSAPERKRIIKVVMPKDTEVLFDVEVVEESITQTVAKGILKSSITFFEEDWWVQYKDVANAIETGVTKNCMDSNWCRIQSRRGKPFFSRRSKDSKFIVALEKLSGWKWPQQCKLLVGLKKCKERVPFFERVQSIRNKLLSNGQDHLNFRSLGEAQQSWLWKQRRNKATFELQGENGQKKMEALQKIKSFTWHVDSWPALETVNKMVLEFGPLSQNSWLSVPIAVGTGDQRIRQRKIVKTRLQ